METKGGFLTKNKREFLTENDLEAKTSGVNSTTRSRIRQSIQGAVFDFSLLYEHLPHKERKMTFAGESISHTVKSGREISEGEFEWDILGGYVGEDFEFIKGDEELIDSIADTIAFLWLACYDAQVDPTDVVEKSTKRAFTSIGRPHRSVSVNMVVEPAHKEHITERARQKMGQGKELSDSEANALIQKKEEVVPNALVFDYLRGDLDQYELKPFSDE